MSDSLVDPTSAAFSTSISHDGSVLSAQNAGGFFPTKFGEADATQQEQALVVESV